MSPKLSLKGAFDLCKLNAAKRGIDFLFTFDEWHQIWLTSGHLHERGPGRTQYCMARHGDNGAYIVGNVKIITNHENRREWHDKNKRPVTVETRTKMSKSLLGNKRGLGKLKSPQTCAKLSKALTGIVKTPEWREKLRQANLGKKATKKTRAKMSAAATGRQFTAEHRKNLSLAAIARYRGHTPMSKRTKVDPFTTEQHWRHFADFCKYEKLSGGPDPQLAMVAEMSWGCDVQEQLWRAMCYIAVYNVPYAEVIWQANPWKRVAKPFDELDRWLADAFKQGLLVTRIERRCVRRHDWMMEYMDGAREFVRTGYETMARHVNQISDTYEAYEWAWVNVLLVPRIGRYVAIKLLEYLRRYHGLKIATPDIRPKDAWSPRHTLGVLWPALPLGNRDNSPEALKLCTAVCRDTITELKRRGVTVDMFELQVLLCEYRESYESRKQYPGRSLDSELGYALKAEADYKHKSDIWRARSKLFPPNHLGEMRRYWSGPRKDVGQVLATHGYTWSDQLYDYTRSAADLAHPVRW